MGLDRSLVGSIFRKPQHAWQFTERGICCRIAISWVLIVRDVMRSIAPIELFSMVWRRFPYLLTLRRLAR